MLVNQGENLIVHQKSLRALFQSLLQSHLNPGRWGYSHTLTIRVCAAQRGSDFEAPDLEQGIHFRGVF